LKELDHFNPKEFILIKGAKVHNLRDLSVAIPKNKLVVITGLSGSGKSSLAFDTLYAEGQRRYVESLSSYARQFMGKMQKPEVDYIKGIAPAIAIEQKVSTSNPRSTVGTTTEIYDYLKLLFARIGKTISPVSGKEVKRHSVTDVVNFVNELPENTKLSITCPLEILEKRTVKQELALLLQKGYQRIYWKDEAHLINDLLEDKKVKLPKEINVVIDRVAVKYDSDENTSRIADSIQTAFFEGRGICNIVEAEGKNYPFSNKFELDGIEFEKPSVNLFSFNNPYGACSKCEGFGTVIGIDEDLVVPDKSVSVYEGGIACWRGEKMGMWLQRFIKKSEKLDFPIHRSYSELNQEQKDLLWNGAKGLPGINEFFVELEAQAYKIQYRVMLARYRGKTTCPDCKGTRLRKDANYVKVTGKSIRELLLLSIEDLQKFFLELELNDHDTQIAKRILLEINNRLYFLLDVGLGYLTLNRLSNSLSGGESQRINLANSLGSSLVGSLYILDEPSIGLHSRDTQRLIKVLRSLKKAGNSVIVVEHDEEIIQAADFVIDIGPKAGTNGGELIFAGEYRDIFKCKESITGQYLNEDLMIAIPDKRRTWNNQITVKGACENNLKNVTVSIPLGVMTAVTGVSGSGKTSLIKRVLYPAIQKAIGQYHNDLTGQVEGISGDISQVEQVEMVDQNPIGKSSRSNPVTYIKAYDEIRTLFSNQASAVASRLKPSHFSFNVAGGRCETCSGEGVVKIEMQFMADIFLTCESCDGKRFKQEILDITFNEKNISDVLEMTVEDAMEFFKTEKKIVNRIRPLFDVGLGYVKLGQSSNTLSGGEAQRIKLASFIARGATSFKSLFIFDEPTTGLHFHDIHKLMDAFRMLIEQGNSIIVIEHNMDVIKCADWVIDMGVEGGDFGGEVVFEGTPEDLIKDKKSHTGKFLSEKFKPKGI
jgi:excinuclease ABC subunit A